MRSRATLPNIFNTLPANSSREAGLDSSAPRLAQQLRSTGRDNWTESSLR
jgi:hypothetical protein